MDLFALTRQLVDIESITGNEAGVGELLDRSLSLLDYDTQRVPVEESRFNLFRWPESCVRELRRLGVRVVGLEAGDVGGGAY